MILNDNDLKNYLSINIIAKIIYIEDEIYEKLFNKFFLNILN